MFSFLSSKKIEHKMVFVLSCLFSYLSIAIISLFKQIDHVLVLSGSSFVLLTLLAIAASALFSAKWFKKLLIRLFHKTPHSDIWRDILDLDKGSNLKVYFKNNKVGIIGHHKVNEENGDCSWFTISAPIKFDVETDTVIDDTNKDDESVIIAFKLSDVEHIEIF